MLLRPAELHLRQNLLLDGKSQTLKICDFGTAKRMVFGEQRLPFFTLAFAGCKFPCRAECHADLNLRGRAYMVSRYYRAPELILGVGGSRWSVEVAVK